MTAIALRGFSLGLNILESIGSFFKRFSNAIEVSRQLEANRRIAYALRHEYPGMSEEQIISELNSKTIRRLYND